MTQSIRVTEPGNGTLEIFAMATDAEFLQTLITDVFHNYWDQIHFGTAVQGGVWEVRAPNAPEQIRMSDGYLTVDFGHWHFHLCIGAHRGSRNNPCPPELASYNRIWCTGGLKEGGVPC